MKVGDLIKQFSRKDLNKKLIMFSDEEGNNYSDDIRVELYENGTLILVPYNQKYSGD